MFTNLASDYGPLQVTNVGYKINQRTFAPKRPPPTLGQHSRQVMEGLGLTAEQIDELYARGITA